MQNRGRDLEKLVCALESAVANKQNVKVTSPIKLRDKRTGRLREHDVGITIVEGHHVLVVAMECRDRSRPVGVPQVEAFQQKCLDTGVSQGAIVSSKGFTQTARAKARAYGVQCLDLEEPESFDWFVSKHMTQQRCELARQNHLILLQKNDNFGKDDIAEFIGTDGQRFGLEMFFRLMHVHLKPHVDRMARLGTKPGIYPGRVKFNTPGLKVVLTNGRGERDVIQVVSAFDLKIELSVQPFQLHNYANKGEGKLISQAASVPIQIGDAKGKLVISRDTELAIKLSFIKDK